MTKTVADDSVLGKIARQQHDLFRRVREGSLDPQEVSRSLQAISEGCFSPYSFRIHLNPEAHFIKDMSKRGWTLMEDVREPSGDLILESLPIISTVDVEKGEPRDRVIQQNTAICRRAKRMNLNLGQRHAEALLSMAMVQEALHSWARSLDSCINHDLIFPGTKWKDEAGKIRIPVIATDEDSSNDPSRWRWTLSFLYLGNPLYDYDHFVKVH
ncbi:MAG: hypothetical protein AAB787_02795 [Patescibacteria group bacterium]